VARLSRDAKARTARYWRDIVIISIHYFGRLVKGAFVPRAEKVSRE
jgi:hypothetical protein